jgi:hypothetical protein
MLKSIYALQPYQVGSKHGKSLVICIPSRIAKECHIDTSTIFALRIDEKNKRLTLQTMEGTLEGQQNITISTSGLAGANNQT